jgi:hypothetical protein
MAVDDDPLVEASAIQAGSGMGCGRVGLGVPLLRVR